MKEKFLKQTIANAYKGLKKGKKLALNVANTKQYKTFEEDTVQLTLDVKVLNIQILGGYHYLHNKINYNYIRRDSVDLKQENRYLGKFERLQSIFCRKFEPTFIFTK